MAASTARSDAGADDRDTCGGWMWCPAWRRAPYQYPGGHTITYLDADGDRNTSAFTDRDTLAQTDPNADFTAARAAACLRPRAWRASGFSDRHRAWKYEPDAGQPDL